jgi:hypothetical protein
MTRWRSVAVAVGQPLVLVGAAAGDAALGAYPGGPATGVVHVVLIVLVGLLWLAGIALDAHPLALFLGSIAGLVALTAAYGSAEASALHERSERTSCAVEAVTERIEYSAYTVPDAGPPAQYPVPPAPQPPFPDPVFDHYDDTDHRTPKTYYDYRLTCDRGPVATASWSSRPAEAGQRIDVVYDPLGLVDPVPAADYTDSDGTAERATAVVATGVMILLRVVGTLWFSWGGYGPSRWRRRRRRRRSGQAP